METNIIKKRLKDWNKRYKGLLNSINIGFMLFDRDYTCHEVNDVMLEIMGATSSDIQGINMRDVFSEDEFLQLYNVVEPLEITLKEQKSIEEKKFYQFEWYTYHLKTGEKIPLLVTGSINVTDEGEHDLTFVTCTDLREQKRSQEEAELEKTKLEAILFGIGDCVSVYDPDGNLLLRNPRGMEIRGQQSDPLLPLEANKNSHFDLKTKGSTRTYEVKIDAVKDRQGNIFAYAEILKDISHELKLKRREHELHHMKRKIMRLELQSEMIGVSQAMRNIFELIVRCAEVDSAILLLGETGVGKELVARAIHDQSSRKNEPFVVVNCGALPENLLESELFGHVKGAFTGAIAERKGLFYEADSGTIFLDEVGDLNPALQVKLLRVLQEFEVRPVGSDQSYKVNVRVIAATNKNLLKLAEHNQYRHDLYYRLAVISVFIPPLRERNDDILPLAEYFIQKKAQLSKASIKTLNHACQQRLLTYPWPGNIRELENCIEHLWAMTRTTVLTPENLPVQIALPEQEPLIHTKEFPHSLESTPALLQKSASIPNLKPWETEEKKAIETVLFKQKGNRTRTANELGICRATLWRKIKDYQIDI